MTDWSKRNHGRAEFVQFNSDMTVYERMENITYTGHPHSQTTSSTSRYPSLPYQSTNDTPYYNIQHTHQIWQPGQSMPTYADVLRSPSPPHTDPRGWNFQHGTIPPGQRYPIQTQAEPATKRLRLSPQAPSPSSTQPIYHSPPLQAPSYAQVAAAYRPSAYTNATPTTAYNAGFATTLQQNWGNPAPRQDATWNAEVRRETPSTSTPSSILPQENLNYVDPGYDFTLMADPVTGWLQVPKAAGERTGLVVNISPPQLQHNTLKSPTGSIAASSVNSSGRRSKKEIMSGNCEYRCQHCGAGFYTPDDRR